MTETITMADPQRSSVVLAEPKALGVHISIDDFGTGYSSLSRLQGFPVDALKIDRTFISRMDTDRETREIVRIIIMLARNLGLKVVAEGAETEEQVRLLGNDVRTRSGVPVRATRRPRGCSSILDARI